jgi:ribosome-associated toxin RatA of RatAB toxin-antitoxin module
MAEQTTSSIMIAADPASVMAVISDFESYPVWAQGVKRAEPLPATAGAGAGEAPRPEQVYFELDASPIKDAYTLRYDWKGDESVSWTLVEGKMLKALDGAYILRELGAGSTEVTYRLALDVSIPLIGMIKRKGEKILIDTALKGLKQRVESLA